MRKRDIVVGALLVLALILSINSYVYKSGLTPGICISGSSCELVQNSEYGSIFGMPVALFGIVALLMFIFVFILFVAGKVERRWMLGFSALGFAFALYFILLQVLVIGAFCSTCLVIDFAIIVIFIMVLFDSIRS